MAAAKKATRKATAKRPYNRKPKAWPDTSATPAPAANEDYPKPPTAAEEATDTKEEIEGAPLVSVDILDMDGLPMLYKVNLLQWLGTNGYIWQHTAKPVLQNVEELAVNYIKFNHANKLMLPLENAPAEGSITRVDDGSEIQLKIVLTYPALIVPNVLEVGNATYMRIA